MATKIVWRLEDEKGRGIYYDTNYYYEAASDDGFHVCNTIERHPAPQNDPQLGWELIRNREEYSFGFNTLEQMHQWVYKSKWRKNLAELGVQLNKYEVNAKYFRRSAFQAVFHKEHAKLVESRRPDYRDII